MSRRTTSGWLFVGIGFLPYIFRWAWTGVRWVLDVLGLYTAVEDSAALEDDAGPVLRSMSAWFDSIPELAFYGVSGTVIAIGLAILAPRAVWDRLRDIFGIRLLLQDASRLMYNRASDELTQFIAGNSVVAPYKHPENYFGGRLLLEAKMGRIALFGARGPGLREQRIPDADLRKMLVTVDSNGFVSGDTTQRPLWERMSVSRKEALSALKRQEEEEARYRSNVAIDAPSPSPSPSRINLADVEPKQSKGANWRMKDLMRWIDPAWDTGDGEDGWLDRLDREIRDKASMGLVTVWGRSLSHNRLLEDLDLHNNALEEIERSFWSKSQLNFFAIVDDRKRYNSPHAEPANGNGLPAFADIQVNEDQCKSIWSEGALRKSA